MLGLVWYSQSFSWSCTYVYVVRVHPGLRGIETDELETQATHAPVRGVADGVELRASDP